MALDHTATLSPATMITRLEGMLGCSQLTEWEEGFVTGMVELRDSGVVTRLTPAQLEKLTRLHDQHFAG